MEGGEISRLLRERPAPRLRDGFTVCLPGTKSPIQERECPECETVKLSATSVRGVEIDHCPRCRGIFFDRNELKALYPHGIGEVAKGNEAAEIFALDAVLQVIAALLSG